MLSTERSKTIVQRLYLENGRNEWDKITNSFLVTHTPSDLCTLSDFASSYAVVLAELSEYLGMRGGYGCGDHGHNKAIAAAQKKVKRARKALGYTYP